MLHSMHSYIQLWILLSKIFLDYTVSAVFVFLQMYLIDYLILNVLCIKYS